MTVSVMIAGALFRAPVQKIAKSGKPYVTATIKASVGSESEFWTALAFGDPEQAAMLALAPGEKLSIQGSMKLEAKANDGEVKIYRTVFVDALLILRPPPRERKRTEKLTPPSPADDGPKGPCNDGGPNDDLQF